MEAGPVCLPDHRLGSAPGQDGLDYRSDRAVGRDRVLHAPAEAD
ncbi:hypothetical protein [Streptomyces sp. NPDC002463]